MKLEKAILKTVAYHQIFDYPLTDQEITKYLIENKSGIKTIKRILNALEKQKKISKAGNYYYFGKKNLSKVRSSRSKYSKPKLKRAIFYASILKLVPTLKLVGVSGALSMQNSHENDDIDLVLITQKGTLWTTRFITNILMIAFKRKPNDKFINNKACLNIYIGEDGLKINDQNIYTAHEIYQLKPLWQRDKVYTKFITANSWARKYLPNWQEHNLDNSKNHFIFFASYLSLLESFLKAIQLSYMKSKVTKEKIGDKQLFFHPKNTQDFVLAEYKRRTKKLGAY